MYFFVTCKTKSRYLACWVELCFQIFANLALVVIDNALFQYFQFLIKHYFNNSMDTTMEGNMELVSNMQLLKEWNQQMALYRTRQIPLEDQEGAYAKTEFCSSLSASNLLCSVSIFCIVFRNLVGLPIKAQYWTVRG